MAVCSTPELQLFCSKPLQTDIISTNECAYRPLASLDNSSVIEFASQGNNDQYRDLSSIYIRFRVKLFKDQKDTLHTTAEIAPANNVLHSLIRQTSISLNGVSIANIDSNYNYRAYVENILNYNEIIAQVHLDGVGFALDTPGKMEVVTGNTNKGLETRMNMFGKSKEVEFGGRC